MMWGGDNISQLNDYYGELTGIYWIWKNVDMQPDDHIGFFHYNKYLRISHKQIEKKLKEYDFLVSKEYTIRSHARTEEYKIFEETLKEYNSDFYKVYKSIIDDSGSGVVSGGNLFVTRKNRFDEYCQFMFPLMEMVRSNIGDTDTNKYYKRYCDFFSERLLTTWIAYREYRSKQYRIKMQGPINWWIGQFVARVIQKVFKIEVLGKLNGYLRRSSYN